MRDIVTPVWVNAKQPADRASVVATIADSLKSAHNPLIIIDAIDLAGAAEAVELARTANATIDHSSADNVHFFQEQGWLGTTPGEAVLRADAVLLIGPLSDEIATDEALRRLCDEDKPRAFRYVGQNAPPGSIANLVGKGLAGTNVGDMSLTALIGLVRAHINGHGVNADAAIREAVSTLGDWMQGASYGVAVFATGALDDLEGYALSGLLDDLSLKTRWNALPLAVPLGQNELQRMTSSLTGVPTPAAFRNGRAQHDGWRYGARRGVARGEYDSVLWVSGSDTDVPEWVQHVPSVIVISAHDSALPGVAAQAQIGVAGVDYPAIIEPAEIGAFAAIAPPGRSDKDSPAHLLGTIRKTLETDGAGA